jgi:uncharacterized protein YkwD
MRLFPRNQCVCVIPLTLAISFASAGCTFSREDLEQLLDYPQSQGNQVQEIQLSPPPEIQPVEGQLQADGQELWQVDETNPDPGSPTPFQPLGQDASPTVTPTPTTTQTLPPGTQPVTLTFTTSPSTSPTMALSPTITSTFPPGITPTLTSTYTQTAIVVFTPTNTDTPTPTNTQEGTPPPPPTATNTPEPTLPPTCNPSGNGSFESALIALINQERQGRGLGPLSPQGQLATASRNHSADMACNSFFSHTGSDGSLPWDRVSALGYSYSAIAENIFAGSSNAQTAFNAWMNSPGHLGNMLNSTYTEIGIGYRYWADSPFGAYTTAVFASPH